MRTDKLELEQLLEEIAKKGFQPIGMIFYDTRSHLVGIAPMEHVPDALVEMLGQRLSGMKTGGSWAPIAEA